MNYDPTSQPAPDPGIPVGAIAGYEYIRQVAANQYGELWLARHSASGAGVALAFLSQPYAENRLALARMKELLAEQVQVPMRLLVVNPPVDVDYAINTPSEVAGPARAAVAPKKGMSGCLIGVIVISGVLICIIPVVALLATIAVPSFLRARKRSQATKIVNDARIYQAAIDQWAIEKSKTNDSPVTFSDVSDYIKASSELAATSGKDILGNAYDVTTVGGGVKINQMSYDALSDVTSPDFWSSYAPTGSAYSP